MYLCVYVSVYVNICLCIFMLNYCSVNLPLFLFICVSLYVCECIYDSMYLICIWVNVCYLFSYVSIMYMYISREIQEQGGPGAGRSRSRPGDPGAGSSRSRVIQEHGGPGAGQVIQALAR